ncbi:MAG TPA: MFS transporter [Victivallales bacterium]|nr:MFS transporter [Victivallales bacterium]
MIIPKFILTGEAKPVIQDEKKIKSRYTHARWSVIISMIVGYGFYYVCRMALSVIKEPAIESGALTAIQLGVIGSLLSLVYAFGKLTNGFIADRCNIKKFLAIGLFASAIINLLIGFYSGFIFFAVMWGINGWFQSMGSAPCVVSLSQWYSYKEKSTWYGIWSIAHYVGEAVTFIGTAFLVVHFGWKHVFVWIGVGGIIIAYLTYKFMYDRPEAYGLPNVADYKNDHPAIKKENKTHELSTWETQLLVIKNPYVWLIGLSAMCLGIVRYAINSWGILFLQDTQSISLITAGSLLAITPIMGGLGSFFSGIISDKIFKSRHAVTTSFFSVLMVIFIILFCFAPGNTVILGLYLAGFGFSMGVLLCFIGGMLAVALSPTRATGAAMGMIGFLSYIGAFSQDIINGILVQHAQHIEKIQTATGLKEVTTYDYHTVKIFWIVTSILMLLFIIPTISAKKTHE